MTSTSQSTPSPGVEFQRCLLHQHPSNNAPYAKWLKVENLRLLRQTFNKFMDIFEEVVKLQSHDDAVELFNSLTKLRTHEWKAMEAALNPSDSEAPEVRVLRNRESQVVITVLQSMVSNLESFVTAAQCKMADHISDIDIACRREISKLHEESHQLQRDLSELRWWHNEDKAALRHAQREVLMLQSALKDKDQRIRQLEKDSNVQLWEEEKQKIIAKYQNKINQMAKKLKRGSSNSRPTTLEIPNGNPTDKSNAVSDMNVEALEQNLRLMERDIRQHARCLRQLQSRCASLVHGFKLDFEKFTDHLFDESSVLNEMTRSAIVNLEDRLRAIMLITSSNPMDDLSALPSHYRLRVECKPIKLERESQPCRKLPSTPSPRASVCVTMDASAGFSHETDSTSLFDASEFQPGPGDSRWPSTRRNSAVPASHDQNPEFLLRDRKEINFDAVMRYFPQMTKEYIEEQWAQFSKFDKNKDYSLDLDEMMGAMYATTGHEFNPREIKEAMLEADLDGSNTIDFFEYLNVANMLRKKSGKSVIESHLLSKQQRNLSKTCSIQ